MGRVFPIAEDAVSCRVCGATHARPARKRPNFGMCDTCVSAFEHRNANADLSEDDFLHLLAGRLALDISRKNRTGIVGRCEAVSSWAANGGYQCGAAATTIRDGRRICTVHARSGDNLRFVGTTSSDPYDNMTKIIGELCSVDSDFRDAVCRALGGMGSR